MLESRNRRLERRLEAARHKVLYSDASTPTEHRIDNTSAHICGFCLLQRRAQQLGEQAKQRFFEDATLGEARYNFVHCVIIKEQWVHDNAGVGEQRTFGCLPNTDVGQVSHAQTDRCAWSRVLMRGLYCVRSTGSSWRSHLQPRCGTAHCAWSVCREVDWLENTDFTYTRLPACLFGGNVVDQVRS